MRGNALQVRAVVSLADFASILFYSLEKDNLDASGLSSLWNRKEKELQSLSRFYYIERSQVFRRLLLSAFLPEPTYQG